MELNDAFFAAVFGELGYPDAPTHYTQGSFYRYNTDTGIYDQISDGALETRDMRPSSSLCKGG